MMKPFLEVILMAVLSLLFSALSEPTILSLSRFSCNFLQMLPLIYQTQLPSLLLELQLSLHKDKQSNTICGLELLITDLYGIKVASFAANETDLSTGGKIQQTTVCKCLQFCKSSWVLMKWRSNS